MCQESALLARSCMARARDTSAHGSRLVLKWEIEPGTLVSVEVFTRAGWLSDPRAARMIHATLQEGSRWLAGCVGVLPLGEDELRALAFGVA